MAADSKDEIIACFWLLTNLLSTDTSHLYYGIVMDEETISKSLDIMFVEDDISVDKSFAEFFYNLMRRANPSSHR